MCTPQRASDRVCEEGKHCAYGYLPSLILVVLAYLWFWPMTGAEVQAQLLSHIMRLPGSICMPNRVIKDRG